MADFGGFQVPTPQELLAQQDAQRQQVFSTGNVTQQRQMNIEGALNALFGNPQVRQAAQVQSRIQTAQAQAQSTTPADGETDIDAELRRLKAVRDAVADIQPDVASQINQQMLKLGQVKFERARLTASDQRDQEEHNVKMATAKDAADLRGLTGGATYVMDTRTHQAQAFDLLDENQAPAFRKAAAQPNTIVITPAQAATIMMNDDDNSAKIREAMARSTGVGSKVTAQRLEQASAGILDQYAVADRLFQVLEQNPDVLSAASTGAKEFDKVANQLAAAGRAANGNKLNDGSKIDDWLTANNITNSRAQSLIVSLAAAQAKANNPDGRISDKDMAIAAAQVGGNNPNPAVVLANLNDTLTRSSSTFALRAGASDAADVDWVKKRIDILQQKQQDFQSRMAKYAQGKLGPGATGLTGAAPAATDDIDAIINKYKSK